MCSWNYGGGQPGGTVEAVVPEHDTITTKGGKEVSRKGSELRDSSLFRFLSLPVCKVIDGQVFFAAAEDPAVELKADSGVSFRRFSKRAAEFRPARCGRRRFHNAVSGFGPHAEQSTGSTETG